MNDNNDFVTFVFMVLFGNHRWLFWSFGIVPRGMLRSHYSLNGNIQEYEGTHLSNAYSLLFHGFVYTASVMLSDAVEFIYEKNGTLIMFSSLN